jgi:dTDP-4-amino-4,6-dideoxygalactose transaminase
MIPVTKPFLPPKEEYQKLLDGIWQRNWLTNNGPLVNELEIRLKKKLHVNHLLFLGNGTISLQIAIKALGLKGEVITTPFSYVATTSSLVWENCQPVFVDIDPNTFNIDPGKIEGAITKDTSAILATHCFGNACEINKIESIAKKHSIKVIYDAAHCFATTYKGESIYNFGNISTASFHATKIFHTVEGGAVVTQDADLLKRMAYMRNFGHSGLVTFDGVGINGKNSEFHAAMGLLNLKYIDTIIERRKAQSEQYDAMLSKAKLQKQSINVDGGYNYAYYPVVFDSEKLLLKVMEALNRQEIMPRRYFYPTLSSLHYVKQFSTPVAEGVSRKILCLPLYYDLADEEIDMISRIILRTINYA